MSKQLICLSVSIVLLGLSGSGRAATPVDLLPTFDVEIGNDAQIGPTSSSAGGSGMGIRNIPTRRRVSFVTYDISGVRGAGQVFLNMSFSNYGHDTGRVNVYGVLEPFEGLVVPGINWSNAPGVKNDPVPPLDSEVQLDLADLTDILLTFDAPARGVRASTETSQALADFLNSDTNGFVAFMFAPEGAGNAIVRTVEMGADGGTRLQGEVGGQPVLARDPEPADAAADVYRGAVLSWTPGAFATMHNVYLGTSFADVNAADIGNPLDVLVGPGQEANTYDPAGDLLYGQTYFWRVDEVNGLDGAVYRGNVWSFTVEPSVYPVTGITATASSSDPTASPQNTVDGSGLTQDAYHGTAENTMWLSGKAGPQPTWIQYEFDRAYRLREMWVWNYNVLFESVLGLGIRGITIEHSLNGTDWAVLTEMELPQAPGAEGYAYGATVDFQGIAAKYVRLTARSNWGGLVQQYGLSEVRFLHIPTYASHPAPAPAETDVSPNVILQWRPGREAAAHDVLFSADGQAVTDGTVPAHTSSEASYDPGPLQLATTYSWKVNEVNEAVSPSLWPGEVWTFTTQQYMVVDDFEGYTDDDGNRVYQVWQDGWEVAENGSQVGYAQAPFAERTTIHGGKQSMPMAYDNSAALYSEATRTFDAAQDWTAHGVKTLSLYFYGPAANTAGRLYVKVNGAKVAYAGTQDDLKAGQWVQWDVDLASLAVDLENVTTLGIGVDGAGASGMLYIDDIHLLP